MKRIPSFCCTLALAVFSFSAPILAHHSTGVFETTTPIHVKGTIVSVYFGNPHSALIVEEVQDNGQKVHWALENSSPLNVLQRRGITEETFQVGDVIEACGFAPKPQNAPTLPLPERVSVEAGSRPRPDWLEGAERVITARVLRLDDMIYEHWSHYGPLEACLSAEEIAALPK